MTVSTDFLSGLCLETERLLVRPWDADEFEMYNRLCRESRRGRFFESWSMERKEALAFFKWQLSKYGDPDPVNDVIGLCIIEKESGEHIGHCGIGVHDVYEETEIFYGIVASKRGKGYATEVAAAVSPAALRVFELPYLIGTAASDNIASQRVLEKCGFDLIAEEECDVPVLRRKMMFKYYRYLGV